MEEVLSDAFDYKGAPAEKAKTGGWVSAAYTTRKKQIRNGQIRF